MAERACGEKLSKMLFWQATLDVWRESWKDHTLSLSLPDQPYQMPLQGSIDAEEASFTMCCASKVRLRLGGATWGKCARLIFGEKLWTEKCEKSMNRV